MAKGSDNPFPSVLLVAGSTPTTPTAGNARLFVDSADGLLKWVDDAGTVTVAGGGAASLDDLTDVDTTGAADGDVLTYDSGTTSWGPVAPAGAGGGTVKDPRWNVLSGQTSVDEFNDSSIGGSWVRVDNTGHTTGYVLWAEDGDALSAFHTTATDAAGEEHALMLPLTSAGGAMAVSDAFIACITIHRAGGATAFGGIVLADGVTYGSGNNLGTLHNATGSTSQDSDDVRLLTGYNAGGSGVDTVTHLPGRLHWVRLVKLASNTWRRDYSYDGISWRIGTATVSSSFTPTYVGFWCSSWGSSNEFGMTVECLRRVSGIS